MSRMIFVNLAVKDLNASMDFFKAIGFEFNEQFTSPEGTGMVVNDRAYVMLSVEPFFKTFIKGKELADTSKTVEATVAFSAESKEDVDTVIEKAIAAGGISTGEAMDQPGMYSRGFYDLDGHQWEFVWMDMSGSVS
ncbi:MAG TPA: VOC family protein [Candidatus Saccharimonadales bacterium]|nr:VOC family protein [Candidatus Saccharimonadales bacterium]